MQPGFGNLAPNAKSVNLIQLKSTHDGDFWSTILCCEMTPKKKSYADFLPSLTFEKCNMDNQLGCSICVLVWLKGIYLTWRGMFGLVFRSANVITLNCTLADFYPLTHTKSKQNSMTQTQNSQTNSHLYIQHPINQSINKSTQRERDHRKPQNGEK
jgi:hypothetical protein